MTAPIFEVENLRAHYLTRFGQKIQAVDGVSFAIPINMVRGIADQLATTGTAMSRNSETRVDRFSRKSSFKALRAMK